MRSVRLSIRGPRPVTSKMPCYAVHPSYRRNVHFSPFFAPQAVSIVPRFSAPFFRNLEADLAQFDNFFKEISESVAESKKPSFQPRFDVKEESDKFVLNGELPGVQPENLQIEFVNHNTMVVKVKVIRQESHGTPPAAVESEKPQEESQDVSMSGAASDTASEQTSNYHKASVEDEEGAGPSATNTTTPAAEGQVAPTEATQQVDKPAEQPQQSTYWASERTVGQFSRAFKFPGKVDQDGVRASLRDGILSVSVPKVLEQDHRRKIQINGE